jgi:glycosyltransferase involved in cell wall biosynthesis
MTNICVFYQYFTTPAGAWGTRWYELARRWVAEGHRVTVVTSVYDKSDLAVTGLWSDQEIDGIRVITINTRLSNRHGFIRRILSFGIFAALSSWFALRLKFDVVIASSGPLSVALPGLLARWFRKRPLVFEIRDLWPAVPFELGILKNPIAVHLARCLERFTYRSSTAVVALSPGMVPYIEAAGGKRVVVIPNAADLDLFGPTAPVTAEMEELTRDRFVAIYAGTIGKANSGEELIAIAKELRDRAANRHLIVVIGDGIELPKLQAEAEAAELDNIIFLGKRPKYEVAGWLRSASVILIGLKPYPILQTSSPNKLFDGLAAGKPVLNNTPGWIEQILDDAQAGFTYSPGEAAQAASLLIELATTPERLEEMGKNARRVAEQTFSRERMSAQYIALLESIKPGDAQPRRDTHQHGLEHNGREAA